MAAPNKKPPGQSNARTLYSNYRGRSQRRAIKFDLTFEEFLEITQKDCYLCGSPPHQVHRGVRRNGDYIYNGIDRINNKKGYIKGNVQPCCKVCNYIKGTLTLKELEPRLKYILSYLWRRA